MTIQPEDSHEDTKPKAAHAATAKNSTADLALAISHAQMNAAYDTGEAVPLAASMAWLIRHQESWWVVYERGWLRVTGTVTAEDLDEAAVRLAEAESIAVSDVVVGEPLAQFRPNGQVA